MWLVDAASGQKGGKPVKIGHLAKKAANPSKLVIAASISLRWFAILR